ncbi:unnamed protein product [Clonostachys rhizophaga]|uniref:Kelch repeat-containing protein n=1 Tax=Clonostachys rhizophaga TaxID=160324 RepID=A0A9N9VSE0_9HYPO|nr:unnamed protein product [Clonostachys rhizophaga]
MTHLQQRLDGQSLAMLSLLLFLMINWVTAATPKDDFCRRFEHQSTVIDEKLYIDGGTVNYKDFPSSHENHDNTWLGYHDLNDLVSIKGELWPNFKIGLSKNDSIPTVAGGALWPDSVNKRFYLYGGEQMSGFPKRSYRILSYDILNDQWDDFGEPNTSPAPEIAGFGAGVGVSETGMGYYYGGWVSNKSMNGWTKDRTMSSNFYSYSYDRGKFDRMQSPDDHARAEGGMVWLPAGDTSGVLVYMGGLVTPYDNGTTAPQPLDEIFIYDAQDNRWSKQKAVGEIPQHRRRFCVDAAWAPDKSSFNIYLWGGRSIYPPVTNVTSYSDIYVLTLPSFQWVKAFPDTSGNYTLPENGKYGSSCNMVKNMSQFIVIGGNYTDSPTDKCDDEWWGAHNLWTGTFQNAGNNGKWWALFNSEVNTNVVPKIVYDVVGGTKEGGATAKQPKNGYDPGNTLLSMLMARTASPPERKPTRQVSATSSPSLGNGGSSRLGTGPIVGIVIGCAVAVGIISFAWWRVGKIVVTRRQERRQREMEQYAQRVQQQAQEQAHLNPHQSLYGASTVGTISPNPPSTQWGVPGSQNGNGGLQPQFEPSELPAYNQGTGILNNKPPGSPPGHPLL